MTQIRTRTYQPYRYYDDFTSRGGRGSRARHSMRNCKQMARSLISRNNIKVLPTNIIFIYARKHESAVRLLSLMINV